MSRASGSPWGRFTLLHRPLNLLHCTARWRWRASAGDLATVRGDHGEALLATVRGDAPPRIHPIGVGIVDGRLYAFINPSPKRLDLEQDGRFALHTHQDPTAPDEFMVRGLAAAVVDPRRRRA